MRKLKISLLERGLHKVYKDLYALFSSVFDVSIISSDKRGIKGFKTVFVNESKIVSSSWIWYKHLFSILKKLNPDIICVRPYYRPYSFSALLYSILFRKKFVVMDEQRNNPHGALKNVLFHLWLLFVRPLINFKVSRIVCITQPCFDYLKKKGFKKLVYIPVPYEPRSWPKKVNNKQKKLKIICVARFDWVKAHDVLVKAVDFLIKNRKFKRSDLVVSLVGSGGKLEKQTKKLVKSLGLSDVIKFRGFIPNDELDVVYQEHNLFILSSRFETVGMVVFEALSNGLPVIVSSNTGAKGSIFSGKNGYIFESDDFRDLAEKILLFKDPEKRQLFGLESIKVLKRLHDPKVIKKKYLEVFN